MPKLYGVLPTLTQTDSIVRDALLRQITQTQREFHYQQTGEWPPEPHEPLTFELPERRVWWER